MKKSNLFTKSSVRVPKFKDHVKNHEVLYTQPFGRVIPNFWLDVAPNERYKLMDSTKLLSSPYVTAQFSDITLKTRYFAVPLRKAVPHFEEFKMSDPSDNLSEFHTRVYDIFRGACLGGNLPEYHRRRFQENLGVDGLANYMGVPWLMDQLCCILFGKDLAYMEEFAQVLIANNINLDNNGNYDNFADFLYASLLAQSHYYGDGADHLYTDLAFYMPATGGTAPNYTYEAANLAYYQQDSMPFYGIQFPWILQEEGVSWDSPAQNIINMFSTQNYSSLQELIETNMSGVYNGQPNVIDVALAGGAIIYLSNPGKDTDNTDTFLGTNIRLAPFCAYQKVRYDWFVDLRLNDNVFEKFCEEYEQSANANTSLVRWNDNFYYTSDLSGGSAHVWTLAFLLTSFVVDYQKDYFTTCAFEPQAGPDLVIGPNGKLPLMFDVTTAGHNDYAVVAPAGLVQTGDSGELHLLENNNYTSIGSVWAEVNETDEITPIKLRWQMALQELLERRNIGGYSRYTDFVLGQYGIRVPDPYLLRSVYLGGFRTTVNTNAVVVNSDGTSPEGSSMVADIGGYASGYNKSPMLRGKVKEHVIVIGVNYIVPQNYYTQGMPSRLTDVKVLDSPHFQFAGVGEQPVYQREVFLGATPKEIFGYQKRYSDKKFMFDEVHGEFLSNLRYFHTGRKFMSQPKLNQDFLSLRGADGHDDILAVQPSIAMPFRIAKYIQCVHTMCV